MRTTIHLSDGWRFVRTAENAHAAACAAGTPVTLPHTWNAADGQDGGNDYYRGKCWYVRELEAPAGDGCVYLEFLGAAMCAEVYLNEELLAVHRGGYSTFRVNLTGRLKQSNVLAVCVDNSESTEIYPQKADFTFYGGLYRDVNLLVVPKEHFALEYCGTPGIKVTPVVSEDYSSAAVTVETWQNASPVTVMVDGQSKTVPSVDGYAKAVFELENVRLWDGIDDPQLYTATAALSSGDEICARFGCRRFEIDPQLGFFLNGRPYPLRGVSRHQDWAELGSALTIQEHRADMDIIREIGANTLRLAHYQHAQEFYDLCDEYGIVVWAEIPYITMHMSNGRTNTLAQMEELIVQNYNHPCIAVWGLSNEITAASPVNDELLENHRLLNELCHRLDATRRTTMANVFMLETDSPILEIPDVSSYNLYFGWYVGEMEQTDEFFDEYHAKYPQRCIGFSEYGADANPRFQSAAPEKGDYTESYQALYHEHMLRMIDERPWLWATHVWNLFDFAADGRDEGGEHGVNQKGLVTMDRKIKKDAFYLYKAAWSREPFVHVCGSRYVDRAEDVTEVKVYSNQPEVALYVDGQLRETQNGSRVYHFSVPISGEHTIEARAGGCSSVILVKKVARPNPDYVFQKKGDVVNWFDQAHFDAGCYSVADTLAELRGNPASAAVVNRMMEQSAASRGDVADAVKDNPALQRMLGRMTLISLLKQAGAKPEQIEQLNRVLQGIRKS